MIFNKTELKLVDLECKNILREILIMGIAAYKRNPTAELETRLREMRGVYESL